MCVKDRSFRVTPHTRRSHFVNREARRIVVIVGLYIARAGGCAHLGSGNRHILLHSLLVFPMGAVNSDGRDSPGVDRVLINFKIVVMIRQALAEAIESEPPWPALSQRLFELRAEGDLLHTALPTLLRSSALESVAAQEVRMLRLHITKTRHINTVRTPPKLGAILIADDGAIGAATLCMIHQVMAEFPARVREAIGKFRGRGIQQDARGFQRRSAQEHNLGLEFESGASSGIDDA